MADTSDKNPLSLYGTLKALFESSFSRANWDRDVQVVFAEEAIAKVYFYTEVNRYCITVSAEYLGCQALSRKARAGENSPRGGDLPDGPFTCETWAKILAAIVGYELVKIHRKDEAQATVEGPPAGRANLHL